MSTKLSEFKTYLTSNELEIEFKVRGLDPKAIGTDKALSVRLTNEQSDKKLLPLHSHISEAVSEDLNFLQQEEIKLCVDHARFISDQYLSCTVESELYHIKTLFFRSQHWLERAKRFHNSFGDLYSISKPITTLRRSYNSLKNLINSIESVPTGTKTKTLKSTGSKGTDLSSQIIVSNPSNSLDTLLNNTLWNFPGNAEQSTQGSTGTNVQPSTSDCNDNLDQFLQNSNMNNSQPTKHHSHASQAKVSLANTCKDNDRESNESEVSEDEYSGSRSSRRKNVNRRRHYMPKWRILFTGRGDDRVNDRPGVQVVKDVTDFVFLVELNARRECFDFERLPLIIFDFVSGIALDWLMIYMRKNPNMNWKTVKEALISRFTDQITEEDLRREILRRTQGSRESINAFILDIESKNNKLKKPYSELDLLGIIRTSMTPSLQDATLHLTFNSIEELRILAVRYEKLWLHHRLPTLPTPLMRRPVLNELENLSSLHGDTADLIHMSESSISNSAPDISAVNTSQPFGTLISQFVVCWNCSDMGHVYQDCTKPILQPFCFGCGKKDTYRPSCSICQNRSLNRRLNVPQSGEKRSMTPKRSPDNLHH